MRVVLPFRAYEQEREASVHVPPLPNRWHPSQAARAADVNLRFPPTTEPATEVFQWQVGGVLLGPYARGQTAFGFRQRTIDQASDLFSRRHSIPCHPKLAQEVSKVILDLRRQIRNDPLNPDWLDWDFRWPDYEPRADDVEMEADLDDLRLQFLPSPASSPSSSFHPPTAQQILVHHNTMIGERATVSAGPSSGSHVYRPLIVGAPAGPSVGCQGGMPVAGSVQQFDPQYHYSQLYQQHPVPQYRPPLAQPGYAPSYPPPHHPQYPLQGPQGYQQQGYQQQQGFYGQEYQPQGYQPPQQNYPQQNYPQQGCQQQPHQQHPQGYYHTAPPIKSVAPPQPPAQGQGPGRARPIGQQQGGTGWGEHEQGQQGRRRQGDDGGEPSRTGHIKAAKVVPTSPKKRQRSRPAGRDPVKYWSVAEVGDHWTEESRWVLLGRERGEYDVVDVTGTFWDIFFFLNSTSAMSRENGTDQRDADENSRRRPIATNEKALQPCLHDE